MMADIEWVALNQTTAPLLMSMMLAMLSRRYSSGRHDTFEPRSRGRVHEPGKTATEMSTLAAAERHVAAANMAIDERAKAWTASTRATRMTPSEANWVAFITK